jgi:hypothetical protein
VGSLDELHSLRVPGLPEEKGIDVAAFEGRHHLRRLQILYFDLVRRELVILHIAPKVVVPSGSTRKANSLADQILRLLDLLPRCDANLLPTGDSV